MRPPLNVDMKIRFCKQTKIPKRAHYYTLVSLLGQFEIDWIVYSQKPNIEVMNAHAPLHG